MTLPDKIIDSHHHLWCPQQLEPDLGYHWLRDIGAPKPYGDPTPIQRDYLFAEFSEEQRPASLAASVHLQCDPALPDPVAETRFIQQISNENQFDIAIVGFADLSAADVQKVLEQHAKYTNFRGVRQIVSKLDNRPDISFAPVHFLEDARWRDQYCLLADFQLSFDLQIYPEQMQQAAELMANHPDIPVVIDHAGSPYDQSAPGIQAWKSGLQPLADLPHTSIKLSGFGMFDMNWDQESIEPLLDTIFELFGPDRIMYGSNYPVDKLMATCAHGINAIASGIASIDDQALPAVFHDNAKRIYRL